MGDEKSKKYLACCELPEHLAEEILRWLPVECLCRFRRVSKQWNALFSSTKFITTKWAEAPSNRMPWLVVQAAIFKRPNCLAYCFFTQVWKKTSSTSLSFYDQVDFCDSSAGLILVKDNRAGFILCNPLTRTFLKLPPCSSKKTIRERVIVAGEGDSPDTYKVVALGLDNLEEWVVEIYDSTKKSWRIASHWAWNLDLDYMLIPDSPIVFCSGSFCYLSYFRGIWNIVSFDITDGTSISAPLPKIADRCINYPGLVVCGSHLLVAGEIVICNNMQVILWEFEKVNVNSSSPQWKEIARMPPSMCEGVNRLRMNRPFDWMGVGVKDCACFMVHMGKGALEVVVYSVSEKTWSWLPSCPLDFEGPVHIIAFEPRPDMKVQ